MKKRDALVTLVCLTLALVTITFVATPALSFLLGNNITWQSVIDNIQLGLRAGAVLSGPFGPWGFIAGVVAAIL